MHLPWPVGCSVVRGAWRLVACCRVFVCVASLQSANLEIWALLLLLLPSAGCACNKRHSPSMHTEKARQKQGSLLFLPSHRLHPEEWILPLSLCAITIVLALLITGALFGSVCSLRPTLHSGVESLQSHHRLAKIKVALLSLQPTGLNALT